MVGGSAAVTDEAEAGCGEGGRWILGWSRGRRASEAPPTTGRVTRLAEGGVQWGRVGRGRWAVPGWAEWSCGVLAVVLTPFACGVNQGMLRRSLSSSCSIVRGGPVRLGTAGRSIWLGSFPICGLFTATGPTVKPFGRRRIGIPGVLLRAHTRGCVIPCATFTHPTHPSTLHSPMHPPTLQPTQASVAHQTRQWGPFPGASLH